MQKYLSSLAALTIVYVVPLCATPGLLLNFKMFVLTAAFTVMMLTQPAMSPKEAREKKLSDRNSMYFILLAGVIGQVTSIIEWAYFKSPEVHTHVTPVTIAGFLLLTAGLVFRVWSIRTLGKFFTSTVQVQQNQRIIKAGPYRIIRHPSYLGACVAIAGSTLFLESALGTIVAVVAMAFAYRKRIAAEEATLADSFGDEYRIYQKQTYRMIPCVW